MRAIEAIIADFERCRLPGGKKFLIGEPELRAILDLHLTPGRKPRREFRVRLHKTDQPKKG